MLEILYFCSAFICGFIVFQCRLPPLIGFLAAGFILHALGYRATELLHNSASLGVTLLLFSIGLKLQVKTLTKFYVWAPSSLHLVLSSCIFSALVMLLARFSLPLFVDLNLESALLIGFAFSFSSTVFAVKVLEQRGEMASFHGKLSIGILVMQDLFAVVFLAISTGQIPNFWSLGILILLPVLRPIMYLILDRSKHGELLPLFGFFFSLLIGYQLFEFAELKGDLGALIVGMLFAPHKKSAELAKSLLSFKDLMLVGFFLSIGLNATLSIEVLLAAVILMMILPIKVLLYYLLTNLFKLRARTSLLNAFTLSNYSEFGLIVCALAASNDWISNQWLAVVGIALSLSFIIATPLNTNANFIYARYENWLCKYESKQRLSIERPVELGNAQVLIFGMGRIGTGAYETLSQHYPNAVTGVDINQQSIDQHLQQHRTVILADATDPDFWQSINHSKVQVVLLAMSKHVQNLLALEQLQASGFQGKVSAIAYYPDQQKELEELGVDSTYNFYRAAGSGFAEHVTETLS